MGTGSYGFFAGMITMGFVVAALFFFRFWRRTGDALFALFGISFCFFALNQALTALSGVARDEQGWFYLLRLAGYVLLIVGIAGKNWKRLPNRNKPD
jgi:hypothetical protein